MAGLWGGQAARRKDVSSISSGRRLLQEAIEPCCCGNIKAKELESDLETSFLTAIRVTAWQVKTQCLSVQRKSFWRVRNLNAVGSIQLQFDRNCDQCAPLLMFCIKPRMGSAPRGMIKVGRIISYRVWRRASIPFVT